MLGIAFVERENLAEFYTKTCQLCPVSPPSSKVPCAKINFGGYPVYQELRTQLTSTNILDRILSLMQTASVC